MKKILNNKLLFPSIIILFIVLIIALIILDANDIPSNNGVGYIHFDWIMIVCTCVSALATFILAMISKKQNEKLSDLNEKSLETAKKNNGYSLIHFRETQYIKNSGKLLKLKLYDTKNIPLKYIQIKQIRIESLKEKYRLADSPKIVIMRKQQKTNLEFTPINPENPIEFYYANIEVNFPFEKYNENDFLRIGLDIEIVNALGVSTTYEYYILSQVVEKTVDEIKLYNYYEFNYCKNIRAL